MTQKQISQKKYLTTKNLYFLPQIKPIKIPKNRYFSTEVRLSSIKFKTIEQIKQKSLNKTIKPQPDHENISPTPKQLQNRSNLYNKYEMLPKIYTQIPKIQPQKQLKNCKIFTTKNQMLASSLQAKPSPIVDELTYYDRNSFNKRLLQQSNQFSFQLKYKYKEKLFGNQSLTFDQIQQNSQVLKKKYYKINTDGKENIQEVKELEKVPDFLLKVLDGKKKIQNNV